MELQLGLAPPSVASVPVNRVMNNFCHGPLIRLGYNWFSSTSTCKDNDSACGGGSKKRSFGEVVEENIKVPETLPLLLWNKQPNDEDGNGQDLEETSSHVINKNDEHDLVGWPPVKTWRTKKIRRQSYNGCRLDDIGGCGGYAIRPSNSRFVKVKMEGVGIARKIDLTLHHSFETLTTTLNEMFGNENQFGCKLAFQDRDGHWLLAEGTPWRTFIGSVQRLMLLRI
ncbi:hypothetical protein SLE2022_265080 [Rubroshorea leprosula]